MNTLHDIVREVVLGLDFGWFPDFTEVGQAKVDTMAFGTQMRAKPLWVKLRRLPPLFRRCDSIGKMLARFGQSYRAGHDNPICDCCERDRRNGSAD